MSYWRRRVEVFPPQAGQEHDSQQLDSAQRCYQSFHGFPPRRILRSRCPRAIPRTLVHLGELHGVIYRARRGASGRPLTFIHRMETPPLLACDPTGKQLYILGGNYRVTRQGIEG